MTDWPILTTVTFAPLIMAVIIFMFVNGDEEDVARGSRWAALWGSLGTFLLSLLIWVDFDNSAVRTLTRGTNIGGAPLPQDLIDIVAAGGILNVLKREAAAS